MLPLNGTNPFVARFSPPSSVTSSHKVKPGPPSRHSSALDIPAIVGSLGRHVFPLPLSPADTASPCLAASAGTRPAEPTLLCLDGASRDVSHETLKDQASQSAPAPLSRSALRGLEKSQVINSASLAQDHLPRIMLGNGPLAMRHIMSCLAQTIPGFSRIPPQMARKMLAHALEARTVSYGDVAIEYRKVGRGRWDARMAGSPFDADHPAWNKMSDRRTPSESDADSCTFSRPGSVFPTSPKAGRKLSATFNDEAVDDMSMDDASNLSSGDETEAEDWFSMGPAVLQKSTTAMPVAPSARINYNAIAIPGSVYRRRFSSSTSRSRRPSRPVLSTSIAAQQALPALPALSPGGHNFSAAHSPQERDAIDALLQLGSM